VSRYGATTPALLKWFEAYNLKGQYSDQVKPFNFLNAFHAQPRFELPDAEQWAKPKRGRPRKQLDMKPIAPFNRNIRDAAHAAFDRETGEPILPGMLMTYAEVLAQYHLRPESKFLNGDFCDRGRTERRHVIATQLVHIGKEANKWEEQHFLGEDEDAEIEYGVAEGAGKLDATIRDLCDKVGEREAAKMIGISRTALRRALKRGAARLSQSTLARIQKSLTCTPPLSTNPAVDRVLIKLPAVRSHRFFEPGFQNVRARCPASGTGRRYHRPAAAQHRKQMTRSQSKRRTLARRPHPGAPEMPVNPAVLHRRLFHRDRQERAASFDYEAPCPRPMSPAVRNPHSFPAGSSSRATRSGSSP
jgi:hypothetical protein